MNQDFNKLLVKSCDLLCQTGSSTFLPFSSMSGRATSMQRVTLFKEETNSVSPANKIATTSKKSTSSPTESSFAVPQGIQTFWTRGQEPDTRLEVLGTPFEVHSTVLKMHSGFFFTFFDSSDKVPPRFNVEFRYGRVTFIEADVDWTSIAKVSETLRFLQHLTGPLCCAEAEIRVLLKVPRLTRQEEYRESFRRVPLCLGDAC